MKVRFLALAACFAATFSLPSAARETLILDPSSPWVIDYDSDSCALRRNFGTGEQLTQLEMRRFQPGLRLQVGVVTQAAKMSRGTYSFRFQEDAEWEEVTAPLYAYFGEGFEGIVFTHHLVKVPVPDDAELEDWDRFYIENDFVAMEAEAARNADRLAISQAFKDDLVLKTGSLTEPIAALNTCIDELLTHWDIDVAAHRTRTRSAVPVNIKRAARMLDYPPKMLRQSLPGLVNIRLDIDESGQVSACHIQMPLSDPEFEKESCTTLKRRLKFDPALDKDGKPMKSYYVNVVRFQVM